MQNRAKLLIQNLKDYSDVISWNANGQLVSEGSIIPNSNIVDLVNDVMRKRKGFNPEHSSTFAKALAKINVPEDYVLKEHRSKSIPYVGTVDYNIFKHQDHHLHQQLLSSLLKSFLFCKCYQTCALFATLQHRTHPLFHRQHNLVTDILVELLEESWSQ